MHVWLCDNARPVWQAPCIIALGWELHNNVVQGNACGVDPLRMCCSICLQPVLHTCDAEETIRLFFSSLFSTRKDGENHSKIPPSFPSLRVNPVSHTGEFTGAPTAERRRRQTEMQHILRSTLRARTNPPPKQMITCPQSATKPTQTKTKKGSTDSKWLFTWPLHCEPVKQPVWVHVSAVLVHPDFL